MKKITPEELQMVLEKHRKWLNGEPDGYKADLSYTDLDMASLNGASLNGASLKGASLEGASLNGASLDGASLYRASLDGASLVGASLNGASLNGASLEGIKSDYLTAFFAIQCPEEGAFIGWKKAGKCVVKLMIPDDAKRSSATSRKCRCSKAKVLAIWDKDGSPVIDVASDYDNSFVYRVGETVEVPDFDENRWKECSSGIHFFITRAEAEAY